MTVNLPLQLGPLNQGEALVLYRRLQRIGKIVRVIETLADIPPFYMEAHIGITVVTAVEIWIFVNSE